MGQQEEGGAEVSANTGIEWCDNTWNPVSGCTRVSAGCDSCYAVPMTHRLEKMGAAKYAGLTVLNKAGDRHFNGVVRTHEEALTIPLKWKKPRRIFVNSMADLFHDGVPFEFVDRVFAVMALCPQHTFIILTKRPERMAEYFETRSLGDVIGSLRNIDAVSGSIDRYVGDEYQTDDLLCGTRSGVGGYCEPAVRDKPRLPQSFPLPNVILGVSAENQAALDERLPHLLRTPAACRALSLEPLLGEIDIGFDREILTDLMDNDPSHPRDERFRGRYPFAQTAIPEDAITRRKHWLGWVIVGGESGPDARPMHPQWARDIRDQCQAAGVPFFFKQWGGANKKRAGRELDGRTHDDMPRRMQEAIA